MFFNLLNFYSQKVYKKIPLFDNKSDVVNSQYFVGWKQTYDIDI